MLPVKKICSTPYSKQMPAMDSCRGASPVACSGATLGLWIRWCRLIGSCWHLCGRSICLRHVAVLAAESLAGGWRVYRAKIFEYATLDLDPEAIYQIGVAEVAEAVSAD